MAMDLQRIVESYVSAGRAYATAVVVRAAPPTSARAGDRAVISDAGVIYGWVGGSCSEPTVLREARAALEDGRPRLVQITPDAERTANERSEMIVVAMRCFSGGTLEVFVEPYFAKPMLVVCGNSPIAQSLVVLGDHLGYRVTVFDRTDRPPLQGATKTVRSASELEVDERTAVVIASHGHFDAESLEAVLPLGPAYVGLVSSHRRFEAVKARLVERGLTDAALSVVRAPAGLDIGAKTAPEVAMSILVELTQLARKKLRLKAADQASQKSEDSGESPRCAETS